MSEPTKDNNYLLKDKHLENEKIQILLRILLISLVILTLPQTDLIMFKLNNNIGVSIFAFMMLVASFNAVYYLLIQMYPYLYQTTRISIMALSDIFASVYVMNFVNELSAFYPALLLWYIVGYGMRYGKLVSFVAYVFSALAWMILINTNTYWIENSNFAYGWMVAYLIIPLYYFNLVSKLKININELHKHVNNSQYNATHDILTGLPNRLYLNTELEKYLLKSKQFALFFIDLDGFKQINDKFGHHIGDRVLVEASKRMNNLNNFTVRLSGDEFVSIVEYESIEQLQIIAKDYSSSIGLKCNNMNIVLSASIGISCYPSDGKNAYELKKKADEAMYIAKTEGKNKFHFYCDIKKRA